MTASAEPTAGAATTPGAEERPTPPSPAVDATLAALHLTTKATAAYGRDDLTSRLAMARRRLDDPAFRVLVVGEFKQGKSSLVNALLNAPVCPVDDDIATSAPTAVQYGEELGARVLYAPPEDEPDAEPEAVPVPVDRVREFVTEAANPANERRVQWVEIDVPRKLLADGLVLVDTPGVGGLGSVHGAITAAALPMADGVLFLSDASQEFSEPEMTFLKQALSLCPNVCCVLTKTDFYPAWRKILELDRQHLAAAKLDLEILPVSSVLRQRALEIDDRELNAESGFPRLIEALRTEIVGDGERRSVEAVCSEVLAVIDQLESQFRSEEKALGTPESAEELQRELARAREKSDRLKSQASRWAQTLNDGIGDLTSDLDHDLRSRFRQIIREADEVIDEGDPAEFWDEFEPWLYRRTAEDVVYSFQLLQSRAETLSEQVAELFEIDEEVAAFRPDLSDSGASLRRTNATASADFNVMSKGQRAMTGFRGGYIGVLMFGALGSMIGLTIGALPIAAGLLMGRKSLRDEQERQLNIRRTTAKNAVRKYLDEAQFLAGKEQRDTLRRLQRQLRDYYNTRAEELNRSIAEATNAAAQALKADEQTRAKRLRDVQAELQRIQGLRKQAIEARNLALGDSTAAAAAAAKTT